MNTMTDYALENRRRFLRDQRPWWHVANENFSHGNAQFLRPIPRTLREIGVSSEELAPQPRTGWTLLVAALAGIALVCLIDARFG